MLLSAAAVPQVNGASVATDDASSYASVSGNPYWNPPNASSGPGNGTGFGNWTFTQSASGNTSQNGFYIDTTSKAISIGTKSWAMYANSSQATTAERAFTGSLSVGQTFQVDLQFDGIGTGTGHGAPPGGSNARQAGFELRSGSTSRFRFYFVGGQTQCQFDDSASGTSIGTGGFPSGGFRVVFKLLTADTYEFAVLSGINGTLIYGSGTRTLGGTAGTGIDRVALYDNDNQEDSSGNIYFNSLKIGAAAPTISAQPAATPICSGGSASMSVTAASTDGSTLSYAWRRRGNGWTVGGGSGWTIQGGGTAFIQNGGTNIGTSWGLQENTGCNPSVQDAYRNLPATMAANQTLSVDYQISTGVNTSAQNGGCAAGTAGISLQDTTSGGLPAFEFYFQGGQSNFFIADSTGQTRDSGIPFTTQGVHIDFTLTSSTTYSLRITRLSDKATYVVTGTVISSRSVNRIRFFAFAGGNGNNFYFNNISVAGPDDNAGNYGTSWSTGDDKGQSPLGASPLGGGTAFTGANSATLSFSNANTADSGKQFDCAVMSGQGYTTISSAATLTVNPLPTITLGSSPSVTYGSTNASLPYTATSNNPDQYSITFDSTAISAGFANVPLTALPASPIPIVVPSNASAATYNGTINVLNSAVGCTSSGTAFTVTITKATPTLSVTNSPVTYSGSAQAASVSGSVSGTVSNVKYNGASTVPTSAATYAVTADFTPSDTTNYNSLTGASAGNFVIQKATPTISVTNSPVTYNGSAQAASVSGSVSGTVSNVKYNGSSTVPTNTGTYTVTADFTPSDSTDYNSLTGASAGNFVIQKATPTVSVTNSPATYNGSPQAAAVSGSVSGTVSNVKYDGSSTVPTNAGTNAVTADFTPSDTTNYNSLSGEAAGDFVIQKATLTVTPNAVSTPYDSTTLDNAAYSDNTANYSITGFQNSETISSAGVTLSGSLAFNGSTSTTVKNAGTYSQSIGTLTLSATNYAMSFSNPTPNNYVITAKSVNVGADSGQSKAKGTSDPTFTYTADSLFSGDSYSGVLSRVSGESAGSYAITIGTLTAGSNYHIDFTGADFVITGPVAANDTATRPTGSSNFNVLISDLLANDIRIASDGSTHSDGLSITGVSPGTGVSSVEIADPYVSVQVNDPSSTDEVTFTYTVSDGTSNDIATVTVNTAPFILQIAAVQSLSYNSGTNTTTTTIDLVAVPNQIYTIEYSTDLATWSPYPSNPVNTANGSFSITVTAPGNHTAFFFRASE